MKRDYRPHGYETCVHSRKRQHAAWRVFKTCANPLSQPGSQLPYPRVCDTCPFYRADRAVLKRRERSHE